MEPDVTLVVETARRRLADQATANPFLDHLESGEVARERLRDLAGELYHLVLSDRRSFAAMASRFPAAPAGDLFLALALGEGEALRLLLDFAAALDLDEEWLRGYETRPLTQAYPAFLTQTSCYGTRSDVTLALLANVDESGRCSARVADALQSAYGFEDKAVAHFRYFADTPGQLLDEASAVLAAGLAEGDDPVAAIHTARMVHAYETTFWHTLAG